MRTFSRKYLHQTNVALVKKIFLASLTHIQFSLYCSGNSIQFFHSLVGFVLFTGHKYQNLVLFPKNRKKEKEKELILTFNLKLIAFIVEISSCSSAVCVGFGSLLVITHNYNFFRHLITQDTESNISFKETKDI